MTYSELKNLVRKGEGQHLEFKKKADHPEKIVREMVAFANSTGGTVLLGVEDNGTISGLPFPEEEQYVMEAAIFRYCKPELPFRLEFIKVEKGREVLAYFISEGNSKPYSWLANPAKTEYKVYVRKADQSLQASKEMLRILKKAPLGLEGTLRFSTREKRIFNYLGTHPNITLSGFSAVAGIPKWKASRILVQWVLQGILSIQPGEPEDFYFLSPSFRPEG